MDILLNRMQTPHDFFLNDKSNYFKKAWDLTLEL